MLVWSCIAPHGGELIPELAGSNLPRMARTRAGMEQLGRDCRETAPDTIVVYTPHGVTISGYVSVCLSPRASGKLESEDGGCARASFATDTALAHAICDAAAARGVSVAPFVVQSPSGRDLPLDLDWGAFVPLWFMGARWPKRPRIVVVCPCRDLPQEQLITFGRAVADAADAGLSRVAVVCSADLGHGHDEAGPYGFAKESAEYDEAFCAVVREGRLVRLLEWEPDWVDRAMTDSFWPALMLHGAHGAAPGAHRPRLLSYEAPTYFGMACASFARCELADGE